MTILLDKNVITDIARGNTAAAEALKRLLASGEPVYISRAAYNELVRDSPVRMRMSYELLLKDLKITTAPQSAAKGGVRERGEFLADNVAHQPAPGQLGQVREYGKGKDNTTPGDAFVAAEAKALKARLWTLDANFAKRARNLGVTLATESSIKGISGAEDLGRARRLMGLKPVSFLQNAAATTAVKRGGPAGPGGPSSGGSASGGGSRAKTAAHEGAPIEPVKEYGPDARGDAKFQGATLAFQGVNFVLQKINNAIQARRFEAAWAQLAPEVRRRLDADPQLGALVLISYAKDRGDAESAIDTVTVFQSIQVGYGLNVDDALRDAQAQARLAPGRSDVGDRIWLKPRAPTDIARLRLPFGTTIAGLATFVPGKEKLVRIRFSGRLGFDDKLFSREELAVPAGMTPRFYYLWPPEKITYFWSGAWRSIEVDWEISTEADATRGDVDPFQAGVPVVKLDSWINPYDASAAMVWPADNSTANLFMTAHATQDSSGLLAAQGLGPMRWVRPEFIRILKAPVD